MLNIWPMNFADSSVPLLLDNALDTLQKEWCSGESWWRHSFWTSKYCPYHEV